MTPAHHPTQEQWLDYTTGQLDPATRTLLDGHLAFCGLCREQVKEVSDLGARVLAEGPEEPVPLALLGSILARLKVAQAPVVEGQALPIPERLWPLLPDLGSIHWQGAFTPGFRFLKVLEAHGTSLFLIHMTAGSTFPRHGHTGPERSLVLAGGLQDDQGTLEAGDFEEATAEHVHAPVALPDEDCWMLASLDGRIRFQGWRGALQRLTGR